MRYSQSSQNIDSNNVSVLNALENDSTKQALTQSMLSALQEYDGSDREATIPELDQVELVAERTGIDPLEVGISKLKELTLANIVTLCKEEGLSWHKLRQHLIEQYSNVPYVPDAMFAYSKKSQLDNFQLSEISGYGMGNLAHLQPLGTSYKEVGCKGPGILVHSGKCF